MEIGESNLKSLTQELRNWSGIARKRPIKEFRELIGTVPGYEMLMTSWDDCAAIPDDGKFLLFAGESVRPELVQANPKRAGQVAVLAAVNDVYAMGGRPKALVDICACADTEARRLIATGLGEAARKYRVPIVGGHLHPDAEGASLSVAIIGEAKALLRCSDAKQGDAVCVAWDYHGGPGPFPLTWDANSKKSSEDVVGRLEVLPDLAEAGLARCAKDISNAGLLGTLAMILDSSGVGAEVALERIHVPEAWQLTDWLKVFPSFGFLICCPESNYEEIARRFSRWQVEFMRIGKVVSEKKITLTLGAEREYFIGTYALGGAER